MFKRFISLLLIISIFLLSIPTALANDNTAQSSVEDILNEYHQKILDIQCDEYAYSPASIESSSDVIKQDTINKLNTAGFQAYDVNPSTYTVIENELNTDFDTIGLDSCDSYIVVVSGENTPTKPASAVPDDDLIGTNKFSYTSNGTTYTMRYLTVTAANRESFKKANTVNILESSSQATIVNCLDTLLYLYIDNLFGKQVISTVASLCGLSFDMIKPATTCTLQYNAGTNWTRTYTQVWDSLYNSWRYGSSVEYVNTYSYLSGMYYDRVSNQYTSVDRNDDRNTNYTDHYFDYTWRKEQAVIGYESFKPRGEFTGTIKYYYGNKAIVTHTEDYVL